MSSSPQLICRGLQPGEEEAYLTFAQNAWGKNSAQAQSARLEWLYKHNPNTRGLAKDLLVLLDGSLVVGAHHRMRIPWNIQGQRVIVPSLHDLFVLPAHRHGEGSQLVLAALAGEQMASLFGLSRVSDEIYSRMRVPKVGLSWLYKCCSVARAVWQRVTSRVSRRFAPGYKLVNAETRLNGFEVLQTNRPTLEQIEEALRLKPAASIYADWDVSSFAWRFFHSQGPDNMLLTIYKSGAIGGRAVISLGLRKGVVTARIVDFVSQEKPIQDALLQAAEGVAVAAGAAVLFAVTSSSQIAQSLLQHGWKARKDAPSARWFSRKRNCNTENMFVTGGAWDFGCDVNMERQ